jgi:hypothetical protein
VRDHARETRPEGTYSLEILNASSENLASGGYEVIRICDHRKRLRFSPALPDAFSERGAILAASVPNCPRAMEASVSVVPAFVKPREMPRTQRELANRLAEWEERLEGQDQGIRA